MTGWRAPLAVQVMGLVIVTLAGAIAAHAAIALLTPPPTPEIYRVSEVAAALRQPGQSIVARNGRSLVARRGAPATLADPLNTPRPVRRLEIWLATSLANELGAKPQQVELRFPIHRPSFEHRRLRAMHEQMGPPSREPRPPPESETPPPQDEPEGGASLPLQASPPSADCHSRSGFCLNRPCVKSMAMTSPLKMC